MDTQKLKLKIGDHEFEAEGPTDVVQAQFAAWRELVMATPAQAPLSTPAATQSAPPGATPDGKPSLDKITKVDGRVVSLTARGTSLEDEILLVLFGQKVLRNNDSVTGAEVLDGLRLTGRTVNRVDYQLDKLTTLGDVITIGTGRARRYRLTNQGFSKAGTLAANVSATVP